MSGRPSLRVLTAGVLTLVLALGGPAATSFADETEPTTTPTSTEVVEPTTTTEPVPTSTTEPSPTDTTEPLPTGPAEPTPPPKPITIEPVPTPTGPWGGPAPVEVPAPAAQSDLKLTVTFKQAEYQPDSELEATVTAENVGDAAVDKVQFNYDGDIWLTKGYQELQARPGPRLEPGERKVVEVVGRQRDVRASVANFKVWVFSEGVVDSNPQDNIAIAIATVVQKRGSFSGVVYSDGNANGRFDDGEAREGVGVFTNGGRPRSSYNAVSDAAGRFAFSDVPVGDYTVYFRGDDVVKPGSSYFVVEDGKNTDLELAAVRPVSDVLSAALELDRESYGRGDPINVKITLTNTGSEPLTGVVAVCNHAGSDAVLSGTGPGWAPLVATGPGTSLAAGEVKVFTIPDVVPDAAFNLGNVYAECNFGNNGVQDFGYVGASDGAEVLGAVGDATGVLYYDQNNDQRPDGEGLSGVTMVALHPKTRAVVARTVTAANGEWAFRGLPAGSLPVIVVGKWKDRYGSSEYQLWVRGGSESRSFFSVVPGPDVPEPVPAPADLEVSASFDKPSFDLSETVHATVTIKNIGGVAAEKVQAYSSYAGGFRMDHSSWGAVGVDKPGVRIEPGGSYTAHVTGKVDGPETRRMTFYGFVQSNPSDARFDNNSFRTQADATFGKGSIALTVHSDGNGNGQADPGEGISGVQLRLYGPKGNHSSYHHGTTGADGKVTIPNLPAGVYYGYYSNDEGWLVPFHNELVIEVDKQLEIVRKATRPLSETLLATLEFDKGSYAVGDAVGVKITLTNKGPALPAVHAFCGAEGSYELDNDNADWGAFRYEGPGVAVGSGETKTFHVSTRLPDGSSDFGLVAAQCNFYAAFGDGGPYVRTQAKVPGAAGNAVGRLLHDHDDDWRTAGQPVANTKIALLELGTGKWVASTVTDGTGKYEFVNVPVGNYTPVVVGPWKLAEGRDTWIRVIRGQAYPHDLWVVPGPEVADPVPATPPAQGGGAAPVAKTPNPLATTGASVAGLSALGIGLMLAGAGSLAAVRRRRVTTV